MKLKSNLIISLAVLSIMLSFTAVAEVTSPVSTVEPGITPDSPFYFLDEFFEQVGNDPQKALEYKEEKLAELQKMAEEKNAEAARTALENALEYGEVLEKEVTPEMEVEVKQSVEVAEKVLEHAGENLPELKQELLQKSEQEQRINLAAEISIKIKRLCETLSKLDPQQYAQTCKADQDTPQWQQKYDQELTEEQKQHATLFTEKMTQCFETQGKTCDCEGMGIKKFEEVCIAYRDFEQRCDAGDKEACTAMIEKGPTDIIDYLPDYLHPVVQDLMKKFNQAQEQQYEQFEGKTEYLPLVCKTAGITSAKECARYMEGKQGEFFSGNGFKFNKEKFMEECLQYKSSQFCEEKAAMMGEGQFEPEQVNFGPGPCRDKGFATVDECKKYMEENFQKTSAGAYIIGQPERIGEFGSDCQALQDLAEKVRCFENFYNQAQGKFTQPIQQTPARGYPQGMEEWQREYYDRWLKAATEEERTQIKMEMTEEMNLRKQQYQQQYTLPVPVDWISEYAQRWFSASDESRNAVVGELREEAVKRGYIINELETEESSFKVKYTDQNGVVYENKYGSTASRVELPEIEKDEKEVGENDKAEDNQVEEIVERSDSEEIDEKNKDEKSREESSGSSESINPVEGIVVSGNAVWKRK